MKSNHISAALPSAGVRSVLGRGRECHTIPKHPEVLLAPRQCHVPLGWVSFMHLVPPSARVVGLGMTLTGRFLRNGTEMLPVGDTLRSALPWCHQHPALAVPIPDPLLMLWLTPHLHMLQITSWVYLLITTQKN